MKLGYLAAARAEQREAATWYRVESLELAQRFRADLKATVARIRTSPKQFPLMDSQFRRALLETFPYSVIFEETEDVIVVVAVAHHSRFPSYWRDRII